MTDTPPEPPAVPTPAPAPAPPADTPASPAEAAQPDGTDWKAMARQWESRAKSNADAAKRLAEIEDAAKTDLERVTAERDRLATEAATATTRAARLEVATAKGVPVDLLPATADAETLAAAADALIAFRGAASPPPFAGSADGGARTSTAKPLEVLIAEAKAAGNYTLAISLENSKLTLGG